MRATARIENLGRRKGIVVTELPYGVGTEKVIERIKTLVQTKKLQGISDIKDLTDRAKGLRLVIEVKNGFHPEALLEQLYKQTPMEDSFGINTVALVDGQPRTLGLRELLEVFLDHRFEVVRRRSVFRRGKAADRLHLVEGLLVAILDIDEVIQLIRTSDNTATAKERLIQVFDLTEVQADYILEMPLRRLTKFSRIELEKEQSELEAHDRGARRDPRRRAAALEGRLRRARRGRQDLRHPAPHRPAGVRRYDGHRGRHPARGRRRPVLRLPVLRPACWPARPRDEAPGQGGGRANHDVVVSVVRTTARGEVGVLTSRGRVLRLGVLDLPGAPAVRQRPPPPGRAAGQRGAVARERRAGARPAPRCAPTGRGWRSAPARAWSSGSTPRCSATATSGRSSASRTATRSSAPSSWRPATETLCFITSDAQLLHFGADGVRPQGRAGGGMAGVRVATGERVVWFGALDPTSDAVVVTASGSSTALPGTEPGAVKVDAVRRVPRQGPRHRRRALPPLPQGRGHPGLAWAGTAPGPGRRGQRRPRRPARGRRAGATAPARPARQPIAACAGPVATAAAALTGVRG